jgi:hypothetical protein
MNGSSSKLDNLNLERIMNSDHKPERSLREIEMEVLEEGREWMRRRLEQRLQESRTGQTVDWLTWRSLPGKEHLLFRAGVQVLHDEHTRTTKGEVRRQNAGALGEVVRNRG